MSREWTPGDVASVPGFGMVLAGDDGYWYAAEGRLNTPWRTMPSKLLFPTVHPLVVIDPEERATSERLVLAMREGLEGILRVSINDYDMTRVADKVQAALRSLIEPPKPEEPTDPAARVTDRRDNIWRLLADGEWVCTSGPDIGEYIVWGRLVSDRGPLTIEGAS